MNKLRFLLAIFILFVSLAGVFASSIDEDESLTDDSEFNIIFNDPVPERISRTRFRSRYRNFYINPFNSIRERIGRVANKIKSIKKFKFRKTPKYVTSAKHNDNQFVEPENGNTEILYDSEELEGYDDYAEGYETSAGEALNLDYDEIEREVGQIRLQAEQDMIALETEIKEESEILNSQQNPKIRNSMVLVHTNDIHSHVSPFNLGGIDCTPSDVEANRCFGGFARMYHLIQEMRAKHDNVVLLDAGDQLVGTLYYHFLRTSVTTEFMNKMKYDGMTLGNHEFDEGIRKLVDFIKTLEFNVTSTNIDMEKAPKELRDVVKDYFLLEEYKTAVIGVTTNTTSFISLGARNLNFINPYIRVQQRIDELNALGYERIICLSHNGYVDDMYLAKMTKGIDLIVGGHSHSLLGDKGRIPEYLHNRIEGEYPTYVKGKDGKDVAIVQANYFGSVVGILKLHWDSNNNLIIDSNEPRILDNRVPEDPEYAQVISKYRKDVEARVQSRIGEALGPYDHTFCRKKECSAGNIVADAIYRTYNTDIAFTNSRGVRSSLPKGDINSGHVMTMLPFSNTIAIFKFSGKEVWDLVERSISDYTEEIENGKPIFRNIESTSQWSGLKFIYNSSLPQGERVSEIFLYSRDKRTLTPLPKDETIYSVATNEYITSGGDNLMDELKPGEYEKDSSTIDVVVIKYIESLSRADKKLRDPSTIRRRRHIDIGKPDPEDGLYYNRRDLFHRRRDNLKN